MVLDGASTVGVVENESLCTSVQRADLHIKTGGQGKPTLVHCTKTGILPVCLSVQGRTVRVNIPVRIVPGFGVNILPECFFLQKRFRVDKQYDTVTVTSPDNKLVLEGKALHHNPGFGCSISTSPWEAPITYKITRSKHPSARTR